MVTAGVIFSIDSDGSAMIVADPTFFKEGNKFKVSFPNALGYEQEQNGLYSTVNLAENFCTFSLKPREDGYIKSVKFEIGNLKEHDCVDTCFPKGSIYYTSWLLWRFYCQSKPMGDRQSACCFS